MMLYYVPHHEFWGANVGSNKYRNCGFALKGVRLPFVRILITFNPQPVIFYTPLRFHNTMIYFTSFLFTLLLAHVARAVPARGDVASPQEMYDITYDNALATYKVTWDATYDNPNGNTNGVACSNGPNGLADKYPHFKNFPNFPYIGGGFDTRWGSPNCGKCWKLTKKETGRWIYFTAIDAAGGGFNIGKHAFIALNGGTVGGGTLAAEAVSVAGRFCGFP